MHVPAKPAAGRAGSYLGQSPLAPTPPLQAAANINTPRSIRSRLSFPRRKPAAPDSATVPEAPQQQVVRSASGRTAMG